MNVCHVETAKWGDPVWVGDPVISYGKYYNMLCMFKLEIYTDGKEWRGVVAIGAGDTYSSYGLPFALKTPAFDTEEKCFDYYIESAVKFIKERIKRPCERELFDYVKKLRQKDQQMEIAL